MRIALSGPHGSGKSTLLREIKQDDLFRDIRLKSIPEITREVQALGYPINEAGNNETQNLCIARCLNDILSDNNYIVDRCIVDQYIYTQYMFELGQVDRAVTDYARAVSDRYMSWYDFIFYIPAEFEPEDDGTRSTGKKFHDRIVELFEHQMGLYRREPNIDIIELRGTVEERMGTFFSVLQNEGVI